MSDIARSLTSFAPHKGSRWPMAIQAAFSMAAPIAVATALGTPGWGLQASLGGFVILYLTSWSRRDRIRGLPFVAAGFSLSSLMGVLASGSHVSNLLGLLLVAVVASVLLVGFSMGPPGPLMVVLAYGSSGQITAPPEIGGAGGSGLQMWALVTAGALFAYLVAICPLVLPSVRRRQGPATPLAVLFPRPRWQRDAVTVVARMCVAAALCVVIVTPFEAHRGYWMVGTALAILSMGARRRLAVQRGIHRVLGTLLGILVFVGLSWLNPQGWWLVLTVVILQGAIELIVVRHYALALLGITPLALILATAAGRINVQSVATERAMDTLVGAAIAMVVLLVSAPRTRASRQEKTG